MINTTYDNTIKEYKLKLTPQQESRYINLVISFFTKNLDYWITRPNILDVESPEFNSAFEQYYMKDSDEEEI